MRHIGPPGLTDLNTTELKKLLGHCHRNEVEFPLTVKSLACVGFQYKQEALMRALRKLDNEAVKTLLICVIAERIKQGE